MGLFWIRNTRNRRYLCCFGSYSVFGMNGISFRSFCSRKQNGQNGRDAVYSEQTDLHGLLGNFWRKILHSSSQVTSDSVSRSETNRRALFENFFACILLFLNRKRIARIAPIKMQNKSHHNRYAGIITKHHFLT